MRGSGSTHEVGDSIKPRASPRALGMRDHPQAHEVGDSISINNVVWKCFCALEPSVARCAGLRSLSARTHGSRTRRGLYAVARCGLAQ